MKNLKFTVWANMCVKQPPRICQCLFSSAQTAAHAATPGFCMGCEDSNAGPPVCIPNALVYGATSQSSFPYLGKKVLKLFCYLFKEKLFHACHHKGGGGGQLHLLYNLQKLCETIILKSRDSIRQRTETVHHRKTSNKCLLSGRTTKSRN